MSIGASMSSAWHNHPYIIMGVGGIIVVYFLWPSKAAPTAAAPNTDYANQLAAETALSQAQLAEQASTAQMHFQAAAAESAAAAQAAAAESAAAAQAAAVSNVAIAGANARAIEANDKVLETQILGETNFGLAQSSARSNDFLALIAGLGQFGSQAYGGSKYATAAGLDAYLTGIGAKFSTHNGDITVTKAAPPQYNIGTNVKTWLSGGGKPSEGGPTWGYGTDVVTNARNNNRLATDLSTDVMAANSPFAANNNLLGNLWGNLIAQSAALQAKPYAQLPSVPTLPTPSVGEILPIPSPIAL